MHTGVGVSDTQLGGFNDNDYEFCYDADKNVSNVRSLMIPQVFFNTICISCAL